MMLKTIFSEWTKLISTKAIYWTTALFFALCAGTAALMGWNTVPQPQLFNIPILYASAAVLAVNTFGLFIVSIQAIMVFTAEYRHNYASVTFAATPQRIQVVVAKWLVYSFFAAVMTFITTISCFYIAKWAASEEASKTLIVWSDDNALRLMWVLPLVIVLMVTFSQGVALIVRQTAGAVALMSMWILALENIVGLLPKIGPWVVKYGPMSNMQAFVQRTDIQDIVWGYQGSGLYFAVWSLAILILGTVMVKLRDA
ncbi:MULTISPECIES: multidrug ABC transporter permease [unclassified Corynebacterium]|uniref:multidrug ABC transporter permease n=1 Tax=unclassified Corynebacterium TaxID=2624378 RepID=UPI0037C0CD83